MYRKRTRAAHTIQAGQQAETNQLQAQGWNFQQPQQQQQPTVQFFNPSQHQNGDLQPPAGPSLENDQTAVNKVNGSGGDQDQGPGSEWSNQSQQVTSADQNHNNNSHPYNYNYDNQQQQQQYQSQSSQNYGEESNVEHQATGEFQPELTLDPSGQWYWDYQQQQWFPYYQHLTDNHHQQLHQAESLPTNSHNEAVAELAQDFSQQLSTVDYQQPAEEVELVEEPVQPVPVQVQDNENLDGEGGGHPLGPPDLVDHRPNSSQLYSLHPPDLTSQPVPSLVSHDQHYEFYSQARSEAYSGQAQPGHGMPDVTGQPPGAAGGDEEETPLAPDILRTEPAQAVPSTSTVPSSDRNLYMETGELAEEDVARAQDLGHGSLPPMVGGNEQSAPPLQRLVLGDSLAREVEGESEPVVSVARVVPGLSVLTPPPAPAAVPPPVVELGETRSEAAGSDRRDVNMMAPAVSRAPPPPTPGRDIAGEESGPGYRQRDFESTDERERDTDSGDRYDTTRRRGGSPRRSYRSSTDREEDRRYRRDDERRHRHHRDNRSYYDRREERRRRDEEDDEDDRRSHRDYRDRYRVKREPRDYDERYSVREYDDDRSSHKHPSRPSSRAGSVSHYDPDSSMRGFNMSNMSMSGQWAFMQQQQAMLQQAMQQQMMALNPLQFQVMSTHSQPVWCNVKVILVRFCLVSPH